MGPGVHGWREGDRAGAYWLAGADGTCRYCRAGRENLCERAAFTGWDRDGGFAERMLVRAEYAARLPEGPADEALAPLLCGGVIGHRALRLSGVSGGGRLGLYGFGASALCTIQVAVHMGCEVYVATRSERGARGGARARGGLGRRLRRPAARAAGRRHHVRARRATSWRPRWPRVDRGGVVVVNAIHLDRLPEMPYEMLWWERSIRSVANVTRADAAEFLELAAEIPVRTTAEPHPLEDANLALARLSAGEVRGAAVLIAPR